MSDVTLDTVQAELSRAMVPWPDDYVETLTPHAALLVARQMAMAVLKVVTGAAVSLGEDESEPAGALDGVVNGVMAAVAGYTHALVELGVLPPEAEAMPS